MRRHVPALLLTAFAAACASAPPASAPPPASSPAAASGSGASAPCKAGHSILNATLWIQHSAEYRAAALQAYANARRALDQALADKSWVGAAEDDAADQPPAVVVDVDETTLDNSPFQARMIGQGKTFEKAAWEAWVAEAAAPPLPGAVEFLSYARSRGVTVFYITNRDAPQEKRGTVENLRRAGFPLRSDSDVMLRGENGWKSDKSARRAVVASTHRILLLLGDDLNDFADAREKPQREREEIVGRYERWWGTRWFMIPNPMYGSWERAAIGAGGSECEQVDRKVQVLRTR